MAHRVGLVLLMTLSVGAGVAPIGLAADSFAVSQRDRTFWPDHLTVPLGAVVHIVNDDKVTHHVYIKSPTINFDSGEEPVGTTVDLKFDHTGTFPVRCAIHPTMHLDVTVE